MTMEQLDKMFEEEAKLPPNKTIEVFKKHFNERMTRLNRRVVVKGLGEQTTSRAYFQYKLTKDTVLNVYTDDAQTRIEFLELDSTKSDSTPFWQCVDACIVAVSLKKSNSSQILLQFSDGDTQSAPTRDSSVESGEYNYVIMPLGVQTADGTVLGEEKYAFSINLLNQ